MKSCSSPHFGTLCIKGLKLITGNIGDTIFCISMTMDMLQVTEAIFFLLCFMFIAKIIEHIFTIVKNKMLTVHCISQLD